MRILLILLALALFSAPASAQSTPIQPCEATPSPAKAGSNTPTKTGVRGSEILVDSGIPDDRAVEKMLAPYSGKVRALNVVIGKLHQPLKKETVGAGSLGSFVTDGFRWYATTKLGKPVALTIMNAGGLRKNEIAAGELRAADIFELLPFENALVAVDLTGASLLKLFPALVRDAQSGARLHYKWNEQSRPEFISGTLVDEKGNEHEIDPNKLYTVITIDYLIKLGSGTYAVLQEAKSTTPLNITLREVIMEYVKHETAAGRAIHQRENNRYVQQGPGPKTAPEEPR